MPESGFRPRLQSDPELPHLLPLPARPKSSHEARPPFVEPHRFSDELVACMAKIFNITSDNLSSMGWVIRDCLLKLEEEGWETVLTKGSESPIFLHKTSGETRATHDTVVAHQKLAARLIHEKEQAGHRRSDRCSLAREILFFSAKANADVRAVVSPRALNKIFSLLHVDPADEPFLIPRFIALFREAFFACKNNPSITVDRIISFPDFFARLAIDRWNYILEISSLKIIYCIDCMSMLADGICASCGDCQCSACFEATHKSGNRSNHFFVRRDQAVCSECLVKGAEIKCTDCLDFFCAECFEKLHRLGKTVKHGVILATSAICAQCDSRHAAMVCMQCQDVLCRECSGSMHQRGARARHDLFSLRKAAYSQTLFAGNFNQVLKIKNRNMTAALPETLWYLFYDEALQPFWFNFGTSEIIKTTLRDLQTRPPEEISDRAKNFAATAAVLKGPGPLRMRFEVRKQDLEISPPVTSELPEVPDLQDLPF